MEKIKLKVEHAPKRCDICHQTDLFEATRNVCLRCSGLSQHDTINGAIFSKKNKLTEIIKQEDKQSSLVILEFIRKNELIFGLLISSPYVILTTTLFVVTYTFGTLVALPIALSAIIFLVYMAKTMQGLKNNLKQCKRCSENNSVNNNHCFNCGSLLIFPKT